MDLPLAYRRSSRYGISDFTGDFTTGRSNIKSYIRHNNYHSSPLKYDYSMVKKSLNEESIAEVRKYRDQCV